MKLWKKKPPPPKVEQPRRVTIGDVIQYHEDRDTCSDCKDEELGCVQHPYQPRPVSAVFDKSYYLTYLHGVPRQVDKEGRFKSGQKAERYALVLAGTLGEAMAKLGRDEVEEWLK